MSASMTAELSETGQEFDDRSSDGESAPILVVDDSAVARRLAGGLIERGMGRTVLYAENGRAALLSIAKEEPCLVLTDLQMPEMNGLELVEAIRVRHPHIPVVLMTAFGSAEVAEQVDRQPTTRLEQAAHLAQERFSKRAPGQLLAAEEIDRDIVETLGAGLDVLERIGYDDLEPA